MQIVVVSTLASIILIMVISSHNYLLNLIASIWTELKCFYQRNRCCGGIRHSIKIINHFLVLRRRRVFFVKNVFRTSKGFGN